ncbi:ATP-binding protein [Methylobacterium bullatum]|uniref:ATP-binding protein n=1 Tax=Methylobacterium bullatum TaxID=570505 RepID=UPI003BB19A77
MQIASRTIIVFGLSGVGKSTTCQQFVARHPRYTHISASRLLKDATGAHGEELRVTAESTIQSNQGRIGYALDLHRLKLNGRPIVVDAHSVIDNDQMLVPVPTQAIASMRPDAMVFLEEEPEIILQRRLKDLRQRPVRTSEELKQQQCVAKKTVIDYSNSLGIPLSIGLVRNLEDFEALLRACHVEIDA